MGYRMWDKRRRVVTATAASESVDELTEMMSQLSTADESQVSDLLSWQCNGGTLQEAELMTHIDSLPSHWTICTVAVAPSRSHLLICRHQPQLPPALLAISLTAEGDEAGSKYHTVWNEFRSFLDRLGSSNAEAESSFTSRSSTAASASRTSLKRRWWDERRQLDDSLKSFLSSMEAQWLGCWKVMAPLFSFCYC